MWDQGIKYLGTEGPSWTLSGFDLAEKLYFLSHADSKPCCPAHTYRDVLYTLSSPGEHRINEHGRWEQQPIAAQSIYLGWLWPHVNSGYLAHTNLFLRWCHPIRRQSSIICIKNLFYDFVLWAWHWHLALLCKICLFYMWEDSWGTFACPRTWGGQEPQVFTQHKFFIQILPRLYSPSKPGLPEILFSCLCTTLSINFTDFTLPMLAKNKHMHLYLMNWSIINLLCKKKKKKSAFPLSLAL